jgi:hypothetical protein
VSLVRKKNGRVKEEGTLFIYELCYRAKEAEKNRLVIWVAYFPEPNWAFLTE